MIHPHREGHTARSPRRPARKRFGQHFLEPSWVAKLIAAIAPRPDETFLEIGAGKGALTFGLAARARVVTAVEVDRDLVGDLIRAVPSNVHVVAGDFLEFAPGDVRVPDGGHLRVVGNLPYNVASPILFKLVDLCAAGAPIEDALLMLQREVANRLLASASTRDYGVLTVLVRHSAEATRLMNLPPGAFRPIPSVDSTLVRLRFHQPTPAVRDPEMFRRLVQAVFTRRRKTLTNALRPLTAAIARQEALDEALHAAGIDPIRRPETLSLDEFVRLSDQFSR